MPTESVTPVPVPIVDIRKLSCLRVALTSLTFFYDPQHRCDRAQRCHDCKESDQYCSWSALRFGDLR